MSWEAILQNAQNYAAMYAIIAGFVACVGVIWRHLERQRHIKLKAMFETPIAQLVERVDTLETQHIALTTKGDLVDGRLRLVETDVAVTKSQFMQLDGKIDDLAKNVNLILDNLVNK